MSRSALFLASVRGRPSSSPYQRTLPRSGSAHTCPASLSATIFSLSPCSKFQFALTIPSPSFPFLIQLHDLVLQGRRHLCMVSFSWVFSSLHPLRRCMQFLNKSRLCNISTCKLLIGPLRPFVFVLFRHPNHNEPVPQVHTYRPSGCRLRFASKPGTFNACNAKQKTSL